MNKLDRFVLYFNAAMLVFWLVMLPITLLTGLKASVPYVSAISVWALIETALVGTAAGLVLWRQTRTHALAHETHRMLRGLHKRFDDDSAA